MKGSSGSYLVIKALHRKPVPPLSAAMCLQSVDGVLSLVQTGVKGAAVELDGFRFVA